MALSGVVWFGRCGVLASGRARASKRSKERWREPRKGGGERENGCAAEREHRRRPGAAPGPGPSSLSHSPAHPLSPASSLTSFLSHPHPLSLSLSLSLALTLSPLSFVPILPHRAPSPPSPPSSRPHRLPHALLVRPLPASAHTATGACLPAQQCRSALRPVITNLVITNLVIANLVIANLVITAYPRSSAGLPATRTPAHHARPPSFPPPPPTAHPP